MPSQKLWLNLRSHNKSAQGHHVRVGSFSDQSPRWRGPLCPREWASSTRLLKSEEAAT
jgi:hypothetical protein